jgi:hypothetical protein
MHFTKYVKWRSEKFGAVIFDTLNEKVYVTNDTGNEILGLIIDGLEASAITARLEENHSGDAANIPSDVADFISELQSAGLLATGEEVQ